MVVFLHYIVNYDMYVSYKINLCLCNENNDIIWSSVSVEIECELWKRHPFSGGIETDKRQAISLKCQYCTAPWKIQGRLFICMQRFCQWYNLFLFIHVYLHQGHIL